jgi:plastocyanin
LLNIVQIQDNGYTPSVITIHQWQYVQWINKGGNPHTVTQGLCPNYVCTPTPGGFNSGPLGPNGTYAFQFTQQGTFAYFDQYTGLAATVAVVP